MGRVKIKVSAQMSDPPKRYILEFEGRRVSELGSLAGLRTATLAKTERGKNAVVSMAYPQDSAWLQQWAKKGDPRTVVVRDQTGEETFVLDVLEFHDSSGDGLVFEAVVGRARRDERA